MRREFLFVSLRAFSKKYQTIFFFIKKKQSYKIYITHTHTHRQNEVLQHVSEIFKYLFLVLRLFRIFSRFFFKFFLLACFLPNFLCRVANAFYFLLTCFEYLWVLFFLIIGLCITNLRSMYAEFRVEFPMPQIKKKTALEIL